MTPRQISEMKHAIGLDHKRPTRGRYVPYRNYFRCEGESLEWESLVGQGLATKQGCGRYIDYEVTDAGFEKLGRIEGCKIGYPALELVLKGEWYDMIELGVKPEEYREITPYWRKRICANDRFCKMREVCKANIYCHYDNGVPCKFDTVVFHRAYTNTTMKFRIEKVVIGHGRTEWGAKEGEKYFVIKLGERLL